MKSEIVLIEDRNSDATLNLALDTVLIKKQGMIFVNNKRSTESIAEKLSQIIFKDKKHNYKNFIDIEKLSIIASDILKVVPSPTKQCHKLSECIKYGTAFHHSGLVSEQRKIVENGFRQGLIKIIVSTPTLCLSADTKIWQGMSDSSVSTLNLSRKLFVLSKNNLKSINALKVQKNINADKLIEISTASGYSIKLTANHKILVKRNNKKELIMASECTIKDLIATIGKIQLNKTSSPKFSNFVKNYTLPFKNKILTKEDFYFIGAMIGDGYSGAEHSNNTLILKSNPCIVGKDIEIFDQVKYFCNSHNINYKFRIMPSKCDGLILSKANWLREFLCNCGIEKGENKYISDNLMNSSEQNISALLRGLFDTDGYVNKLNDVGISSISKKLISNIQKCLLRFGIVSRCRERDGKDLNISGKIYKTKKFYELAISNNVSLQRFYDFIGFSIARKKDDLLKLLEKIHSNNLYVECKTCNYKLYYDLFDGRSREHKSWAEKKIKIITLLGKRGLMTSNQLKDILGFLPRKNDERLNHHYVLIIRKRLAVKKIEYLWSLNPLGLFIYENILKKNLQFKELFTLKECPLCDSDLNYVKKNTWKTDSIDGDIYWDVIRHIKFVPVEQIVYDVVLPSIPSNDHLFVANGIIVHNSIGMDLPAFRVIIRDLKRFGLWGMQYISVLEYMQQAGRAGRPSYDKFGEAICIAESNSEKQELTDMYINGLPEPIVSKLAVEPIMRTYILSIVASEFVRTIAELEQFFSETFYAKHYGDTDKLNQIIIKIVDQLEEWGFITVGGVSSKNNNDASDLDNINSKHKRSSKDMSIDFVSALKLSFKKSNTKDVKEDKKLSATLLGHRVSELYLDPYTAHNIVDSLRLAVVKKSDKLFTDYSLLHLISTCLELRPLLRVKSREMDDIVEKLNQNSDFMLTSIPEMFDETYEEFLNAIKTSEFFYEWLDEKDEEYLFEKYDVRPGEIHSKKERADWLLYSAEELSKLLALHDLIKDIAKVRFRLKYGAREELIPLLQLKNIGRMRARKLFDNKIRDISDIKNIDLTTLVQLIGKNVAIDIKSQVGQELSDEKIVVKEHKRKGQKNLGDYNA